MKQRDGDSCISTFIFPSIAITNRHNYFSYTGKMYYDTCHKLMPIMFKFRCLYVNNYKHCYSNDLYGHVPNLS
jgi:hypothetical protein